MLRSLLFQKIVYALSTTAPIAIIGTLLSIYGVLVTLFNDYLKALFSTNDLLQFHLIVIAVLAIVPYLIALRYRWLPASILIPTNDRETPYYVTFSTSCIFEQAGPLVLSYNRNNLMGGILLNRGSKTVPNLMATFMHKYFADPRDDDPTSFSWELFMQQYNSPETYLYSLTPSGGINILPKDKYPPLSCYSPHWAKYPETALPEAADFSEDLLLPEGAVMALRLPENDENRKFAFLLCNTWYSLPSPDDAHPSVAALSSCWRTLWRTATHKRNIFGQNLCIPFIGRGKSGLRIQPYALFWEIVFSWRKSMPESGVASFGLNICIPISEMLHYKIKLKEVISFLTYALKSH